MAWSYFLVYKFHLFVLRLFDAPELSRLLHLANFQALSIFPLLKNLGKIKLTLKNLNGKRLDELLSHV